MFFTCAFANVSMSFSESAGKGIRSPRAERAHRSKFPAAALPRKRQLRRESVSSQGYRLPVWIRNSIHTHQNSHILFSVENRKLIRLDQFLPSILSDPQGLCGARSMVVNNWTTLPFVTGPRLRVPAKVEKFFLPTCSMPDGTHVLARATG